MTKKQTEFDLVQYEENGRTVWILPRRGWIGMAVDIIKDDVASGDKIIVATKAQEIFVRDRLAREPDKDVTVERASGLVRFHLDTDDADFDPREAARKLVAHIKGIRARHRGEDAPPDRAEDTPDASHDDNNDPPDTPGKPDK